MKTNNLFCCAHGILKLGDFGISKILGPGADCARTVVGTPYYMSPELLEVGRGGVGWWGGGGTPCCMSPELLEVGAGGGARECGGGGCGLARAYVVHVS